MNPTHYASAVIELLKEGVTPARALKGLDAVLARKGHEKLKGAILRIVSRMLETGSAPATLRLAHKEDEKRFKKEIQAAKDAHEIEDELHVSIHDGLIGGFQLETTTVRVDRSYRRALAELYSEVIV